VSGSTGLAHPAHVHRGSIESAGTQEDTMKAMDVMVRDVVTAKPDMDVGSAIKLLVEHDISALPVVNDDGTVVGVVSEADLVRRTEIGTEKHRPWWLEALTPGSILAEEFAKAHGLRVGEVMSPHVVSASEETPLGEIATLMEKHRIKRVPIIENGKLVGIVSRSNLIQALASSLQHDPAKETDREIRLDLLSRLADQKWTDFGSRNVIVTGGVVHLWGMVGSAEERTALVALAEGVPGVVRVSDEMIPSYA
jgi:CBS domain-containing protein